MKRCVILSCSRTKIYDLGEVRAIERYDGPFFRVFRKFRREAPVLAREVDAYVVSGKYGLISGDHPTVWYDELMSRYLTRLMKPLVEEQVSKLIVPHNYSSICLVMPRMYLHMFDGLEKIVGPRVRVVVPKAKFGGGERQASFKSWLWKRD